MNPHEQPELYNHILIGGQKSPGVCKLSGFKRAVDWDRKQGGGQDGESTSRKGKVAANGTVTVYLADEQGTLSEQDEWQAYAAFLQHAQDSGIAYDVYHPDLATLKIHSCIVQDVALVEHDGKGGAFASFGLLEYRPPKKKPVSKPKSKTSGSKPGEPKKADPNADAKKELEALLKQAQAP